MNRVQHFILARDIPYRIPLRFEEPDHCCYGKHIILKRLLEGAGLKVRPRYCTFKWSDFDEMPEGIAQVDHEDDSGHVFLEVLINKKWHTLDATWDKPLAPVLQVNEWDGKSSTPLIDDRDKIKIYSPKRSLAIFNEPITKEDFEEDMHENHDFYKSFNEWLDDIRHAP